MPLALASGLVTDFDERRIYSAFAEVVGGSCSCTTEDFKRQRKSAALQKNHSLLATRYSLPLCKFSSSQVAPFRFAICLHRFCFSRLHERLSPKL